MNDPHQWPVVDRAGNTIGTLTLPAGPRDADTDAYHDQFNDDGTGALIAAEVHFVVDAETLALSLWTGEARPAEMATLLRAAADVIDGGRR